VSVGTSFKCDQNVVSMDLLTWGLDWNKSLCNYITASVVSAYLFAVISCLIVLNLAIIVIYVRKNKNFLVVLSVGHVSTQTLEKHYKQERNLFIQCTISTAGYLSCIVANLFAVQLNLLPNLYYHILAQLSGVLILLDTSFVYVLVNDDLGSKCELFRSRNFLVSKQLIINPYERRIFKF